MEGEELTYGQVAVQDIVLGHVTNELLGLGRRQVLYTADGGRFTRVPVRTGLLRRRIRSNAVRDGTARAVRDTAVAQDVRQRRLATVSHTIQIGSVRERDGEGEWAV